MRGRRPELKVIEGGAVGGSVAPPAHVPKAARAEWVRVTSDLQSRGLLADAALGVVTSYVIATWQVAQCVRAIEKDGAFVRTKNGEPKPHPAHGLMNKANELIARLGAELGLTPVARSRKGMQGSELPHDDGAPPGMDI